VPASETDFAGVSATHSSNITFILGSSNNDTFSAVGGEKSFNGNGGHDTIAFHGISSQFSIANNNGVLTVTDSVAGRDGTDQLTNVEFYQFTDKTLFVENADNANIARLYSAAFNRAPDQAGVSFWEDVYAHNVPSSAKSSGYYVSLAQTNDGSGGSIATDFMKSSEFQTRYGSLSDSAFVNLMYQNVLGRAPDQAGLDFWVGQLGPGHQTREVVLVGFAESPENAAKTSADWLIAI